MQRTGHLGPHHLLAACAGPRRWTYPVILEPTDRSRNQGLRLIALAYLAIGMYVLLRRWTAPKATHFYVFCLVSGVLYSFRYTGVKFDTLDWICYWGVLMCGCAAAGAVSALCRQLWRDCVLRATACALVDAPAMYLPGLFYPRLLQVAAYQSLASWSATERLKHRLDQIGVGLPGAVLRDRRRVFYLRYRSADKPLEAAAA